MTFDAAAKVPGTHQVLTDLLLIIKDVSKGYIASGKGEDDQGTFIVDCRTSQNSHLTSAIDLMVSLMI